MIADENGNLYGTTSKGGKGCKSHGCGTVFKLAPDGTETVLYRFCSQTNRTDGSGLGAGLIRDKSGDLYGTTDFGGTYGQGTVFEITP